MLPGKNKRDKRPLSSAQEYTSARSWDSVQQTLQISSFKMVREGSASIHPCICPASSLQQKDFPPPSIPFGTDPRGTLLLPDQEQLEQHRAEMAGLARLDVATKRQDNRAILPRDHGFTELQEGMGTWNGFGQKRPLKVI